MMSEHMQRASEILQPLVGKQIHIIKEEDGDKDIVDIHLSSISFGENRYPDVDGYVSQEALLLYGEGVIINGGIEHLPQDVYEIPIEKAFGIEHSGQQIKVTTERAKYSISLKQ